MYFFISVLSCLFSFLIVVCVLMMESDEKQVFSQGNKESTVYKPVDVLAKFVAALCSIFFLLCIALSAYNEKNVEKSKIVKTN